MWVGPREQVGGGQLDRTGENSRPSGPGLPRCRAGNGHPRAVGMGLAPAIIGSGYPPHKRSALISFSSGPPACVARRPPSDYQGGEKPKAERVENWSSLGG